ncbi:MAG: hypothetical protein K5868_00395 [Lachnospiraceae bacterium]|nr:hypothetical protein [Lachnospiraceae bacterium]
MRRKVQNKKVLRAITIGLAAVLSVTSTPLPVFAAGGDGATGTESTTDTQGQEEAKPTVDSASGDATTAATTAEGYTGTLNDKVTPATGTGTIGTSVASALNITEVEGVVDNLLSDGKPGSNGVAQIKKAEGLEGEAETKFGVELNADGTVKNQGGLDNKVSDANEAIGDADNAKQDAYNALAGKDGVQDKVNTANGLITTAEGKKSTADADTTAANEAIADKTTGKDALENATQEKLKSIETTLNAAVVEKDITQAVSAAVGASTDALTIVNDNLKIADKAYQQAKDAADDAVAHSSSYNRQQMINLATAAQNAANNAKAAATAADKAMETLDTQETAAKTALTNAQTALTTAQNEAIKVLKDYKSGLDAINAKILTANGSRSEAQEAMKAANEAIDAAINLMGDTTDTSVTGAQAKIKAMNEAIETANKAIENVTGLMYASDATKDEKKAHFFGDAEETCKNAQIRLTGNGSNFIDQTKKLADAKEAYDKVIKAKGEVAANKEAADTAVEKIDELINGEDNIYDRYLKDIDKDINDLKALLSTGGQYSYSYLENRANDLANGLSQSGSELEKYVAEEGLFGGQKLTAEQIAKICEVEKDEQGNPVYTAEYKALMDAAEAKTPDIVEYKNGNNKLELKDADYVDSDGNIYKHEEKNVTPSLEDGYYKPGPYRNAWTTKESVIDKKIEGDQMLIMKEVEYEHKLYTQDVLKVDACENTSPSITKEEHDKFVGLNDDEKKEFAIACLCKQAGIDDVVEIEVSEKTATIKVKDPDTNHTNAFIVYKINCDLENIYADSFASWNYYCLNVKVNEFAETDRSRVGKFRETYAYDYTKYTRNVISGEYTEDALKAQETLQSLNGLLNSYNTVLYYKNIADANLKAADDFNIEKAEGISQDDKDKYDAAVEARGRVVTAKANANGYLKKLTDILGSKNVLAKYEEVNGKVVTAQGRLTTVRKKLDTLKSLQQAAVGNLSTTSVDNKTVEILALNNTLKSTLEGFQKYNLDDYNALAFVRPELREIDVTIKSEDATTADEKKNVELLNMDYLGTVRKTLATAINSATEIIERENGNLSEIAGAREILSGQLEKLNKFATDAQTEADRAAKALADWRAPYVPGDDDGDEESSTDTGIIYTNQGVTITGLDLTAIGAGTGTGIRTVAGARTGVAGVRAEADIQNPQVPLAGSVSTNSNTTTAANGEETTANIGDNLVPLAEAPFEKGTEMNMAWLLSLVAAAAAGVGVYAYDRKRRLANAEEEAKKYKK